MKSTDSLVQAPNEAQHVLLDIMEEMTQDPGTSLNRATYHAITSHRMNSSHTKQATPRRAFRKTDFLKFITSDTADIERELIPIPTSINIKTLLSFAETYNNIRVAIRAPLMANTGINKGQTAPRPR